MASNCPAVMNFSRLAAFSMMIAQALSGMRPRDRQRLTVS